MCFPQICCTEKIRRLLPEGWEEQTVLSAREGLLQRWPHPPATLIRESQEAGCLLGNHHENHRAAVLTQGGGGEWPHLASGIPAWHASPSPAAWPAPESEPAMNAKVSAITALLARTQWGSGSEVPDKDLGPGRTVIKLLIQTVAVQSLSCVWLFVTPWTAPHQASLSFTISQSLLKLMSIESVMPSNHLILCCPFPSCPRSFPASGSFPMSQLFTSGGQRTGASASVLSVTILGLMSFRIDWFDLLAVQGIVRLSLGKMRLNWSSVWQVGAMSI